MQHKASFLFLLPSDCEKVFLQLEKVEMVALICFGFQKHPRTNFPRHPRKWAKSHLTDWLLVLSKIYEAISFSPPPFGESQFHPHFAVYTDTSIHEQANMTDLMRATRWALRRITLGFGLHFFSPPCPNSVHKEWIVLRGFLASP